MKKIFIQFCLICISLLLLFNIVYSQGEFNNWYFGNKAGVSFNIGYPVVFLSSNLICFTTGSSNISDSLGNILFYTDGYKVYNRNNVIMPDGWINGLGGSMDYDKTNIAFQQLADPTKYFLFSAGSEGIPPYYLRYSVIDMNLDGGFGDVPSLLNGVIIPGTAKVYNTVTATRHHNNHDIWVVVRNMDQDSNYFASYLVNSSGINFTPVFSNSLVPFIGYGPGHAIYNIKISRDGMKMAAVYVDSLLEFCHFNTSNGQVTPIFLVTLPIYAGDHINTINAEFSIDSKYLYVSGRDGTNLTSRSFIYQFDATVQDSAQFLNSETLIINENRSHGIQLAPDGKIYCSILYYLSPTLTSFVDSLSVINNPSAKGIACNYQQNVLCLQGRQSGYSLPDYVERYYAVIFDSAQCQDSSVNFSSAIWPPADSIHWDFGDPPSGPANYSSLPNPSHTYPAVSGTYTVTLFVRHIDKRTDTTWKVINILQKPNVGPDQTICAGDSVTFDAGACTGCAYLWKDLTSGLTVDTTRLFKTDQPGTYAAIVTYSNGCIGSDTVQLFTTPVPTVTNNPLAKSICSGESSSIVLTSNVSGTIFHWTASLTSGNVTGFSADSGIIINQVLINGVSTPGVVTYHITPVEGSCAGLAVDFAVTVNPGDSVNISISTPTNSVCEGTLVTFTATPINGGTSPSYQWKVNGTTVGTNSSTYTYTPANSDSIRCIITSNAPCASNNPASSNKVIMIVNTNSVVTVSVAASQNPVCAGIPVLFSATPSNGGTAPQYQWKVNGTNVGTNSNTYTYTPVSGDHVSCIMTSNIICPIGNPATSNQITMTVNPNLQVSVSITASNNPVCSGNAVTYTATPVNGGSLPQYQWKVNGINARPGHDGVKSMSAISGAQT